MPKEILILLLSICLGACKQKEIHTDYATIFAHKSEEIKLNGKVKSLKNTHYRIEKKFGVLKNEKCENIYIFNFDEKGKKIEMLEFFDDLSEEPYRKETYRYDDRGKLIQEESYEKGGKHHRHNYKHDDKNNLLEYTKYFNENFLIKHTYQYDEKGNRVEEIHYDPNTNSEIKWISKYEYDQKGNKIKAYFYNPDGSLYNRYTYKYDRKGTLIQETQYTDAFLENKYTYRYEEVEESDKIKDIKSHDKYRYEFDDKGNLTKMFYYYPDGTILSKDIFKYDERGNEIEVILYRDNKILTYKTTLRYDEKGNKIEEIMYYHDGSVTYSANKDYEYDSYGNWIKEIEYRDGVGKYIIEREITYYE